MINKLAYGYDISNIVLNPRQLKAGLKILENEDWLELTTSNGSRIAVLTKNSDLATIQSYADKYLLEIDWQVK
jgi:hypothetical protein